MPILVAITSYGVCAASFLLLSGLVARGRRGDAKRYLVLGACLLTTLWAAAISGSLLIAVPVEAVLAAELVRNAAWLALLLSLLKDIDRRVFRLPRILTVASVLTPLLILVLAALALHGVPRLAMALPLIETALKAAMIAIAVVGLLMLENVLRNSGQSVRWGVKYLCLGLGAIFAYDFFLYADALLLKKMDKEFFVARGFVTALAAPVLAISVARIKTWACGREIDISVSRKAAFHSVALVASGVYLMIMGLIAFYIRGVGSEWGGALQITFMIGALLLMGVVFASGTMKSRAKLLIRKHFFAYKYDYREEWLSFIQMMSARHSVSLGERIVRAMADMMDSPAGALWVWRRQDDVFVPDFAWNYKGARPSARPDLPLVAFFGERGWIVDLDEYRADPNPYDGLEIPDWLLNHSQAWLVIPLAHRDKVIAFLVLDRARAPRRLDWEDRDLIKTTGTHAASYLAEELAAEALGEAERMEAFNRRFAFVVHDIKTVVGQMSLMLGNAERFANRPEFQQDMLETVRNSVDRMKALLEQLAQKRKEDAAGLRDADVAAVVAEVARRWSASRPDLAVELADGALMARISPEALASVLDHLLDNAVTAADGAAVALRLGADEHDVTIEVVDEGPGMDADFVRRELFRPLRTTKSSGYGLGAYQTRHLIREMGGRLDVESAPGKGTAMRIVLPLLKPAARAPSQELPPARVQA